MIAQASEFLKKAAVAIAGAVAGGAVGFFTPLLFDRDVGGALAATIFGFVGIVVGTVLGAIVIRRMFD